MSADSCTLLRDRLDDFVDGLLDGEEAAAVERHLATCASCRAEEQGLRALLREAAMLRAEIAPPRDLWPGIARRIERGSGARLRLLAAAAALLLAVGGALLALGPAAPPPRSASGVGVEADGTGTLREAALQQAEIARLEGEYDEAARALLVELRSRQDLPPRTVAQVEASLQTIDGALAEIRAALKVKPSEPTLHLMLASTHRKKIDLLQRVVRVGA